MPGGAPDPAAASAIESLAEGTPPRAFGGVRPAFPNLSHDNQSRTPRPSAASSRAEQCIVSALVKRRRRQGVDGVCVDWRSARPGRRGEDRRPGEARCDQGSSDAARPPRAHARWKAASLPACSGVPGTARRRRGVRSSAVARSSAAPAAPSGAALHLMGGRRTGVAAAVCGAEPAAPQTRGADSGQLPPVLPRRAGPDRPGFPACLGGEQRRTFGCTRRLGAAGIRRSRAPQRRERLARLPLPLDSSGAGRIAACGSRPARCSRLATRLAHAWRASATNTESVTYRRPTARLPGKHWAAGSGRPQCRLRPSVSVRTCLRSATLSPLARLRGRLRTPPHSVGSGQLCRPVHVPSL